MFTGVSHTFLQIVITARRRVILRGPSLSTESCARSTSSRWGSTNPTREEEEKFWTYLYWLYYKPAKLNNFKTRLQKTWATGTHSGLLRGDDMWVSLFPVCALETWADAVSRDTAAENAPPHPPIPPIARLSSRQTRASPIQLLDEIFMAEKEAEAAKETVYLSARCLHRGDLRSRRGVRGCSFATVACSWGGREISGVEPIVQRGGEIGNNV